jgi:hypothetical protein
MQSLLTILDSPTAAYAIGVPATMVGSILLVAAIIALLGPRQDHRDHTAGGR